MLRRWLIIAEQDGCMARMPNNVDQRRKKMLTRRFTPLEDVGKIISISRSQAYALVRTGELHAIQVGGRGQWRVEDAELEHFIERAYRRARAEINRDSSSYPSYSRAPGMSPAADLPRPRASGMMRSWMTW